MELEGRAACPRRHDRKPGKQLPRRFHSGRRAIGLITVAAGVRLGSYIPNASRWVLASTHLYSPYHVIMIIMMLYSFNNTAPTGSLKSSKVELCV